MNQTLMSRVQQYTNNNTLAQVVPLCTLFNDSASKSLPRAHYVATTRPRGFGRSTDDARAAQDGRQIRVHVNSVTVARPDCVNQIS